MKQFYVLILVLLLSLTLVSAHEHDFEETAALIESGVGCDELSNEQLEIIGDYYMEQMHPGDAHEIMDEMMGGEGSESLKQAHINMARRFYCNEYVGGMGMMGGMMNQMIGGENTMAYGMMGGAGMVGAWLLGLVYFAIGSFIFALIFWYTYKLVVGKEHKKKYHGKR